MIWKGSRRMNSSSSSIAFSLIKKHLHHSFTYAGASTTFIYFFTIRGVSVHLFVCHCFSVPSWLLFLFFCKRKDLYTRFNWRDLDFKLEWSGTKDPVGHYLLNTTFLVTGMIRLEDFMNFSNPFIIRCVTYLLWGRGLVLQVRLGLPKCL